MSSSVLSFTTGSNEFPSEDALVLQLQLSKGQERLVEALRGQQDEIKELQRVLREQQGALLSKQSGILEQQKRMFEQMEQVRLRNEEDVNGLSGLGFKTS